MLSEPFDNTLKVEILAALNDERVTTEILAAALGVLEGVTDSTFNPGESLIPIYDQGRDVGARLPGGVDVPEPKPAARVVIDVEDLIDYLKADDEHLGIEWVAQRKDWLKHVQHERLLEARLRTLAQSTRDNMKAAAERGGYAVDEANDAVSDFHEALISLARHQSE